MSSSDIPIIDASALGSENHDELDNKLGAAARDFGFLILTDLPGFKPADLADALTKVYQLPLDERAKLLKQNFNSENANKYRGMYSPSPGAGSNDRPQGYDIGPDICYPLHEDFKKDILREPTPVPPASLIPGWQAASAHWYRQAQRLGINILASLARANGFDEASFAIEEASSISTLRILHYPQFDLKNRQSNGRDIAINHHGKDHMQTIGPHVDSGLITILYQCNEPGLQARIDDELWLDVPVIENSFVINFGGLLERMTGGRIKATQHRVISQGYERFSIPFFFEPEAERTIKALPGVPPFEPFYYGDYLWTKATQFPPNIGLEPLRKNRGTFIDPIANLSVSKFFLKPR